jgi:hypothetical protein
MLSLRNPGFLGSLGPFADGGTITTATISGSLYRIHTFTSNGTFTVHGPATMDYLIVAGGGGGGSGANSGNRGGGAGAGGLLQGSTATNFGSYAVVVGNAGVADTNGGNSSVFSVTATGGGRGATTTAGCTSGGSGGGGTSDSLNSFNTGGCSGISGQGFGGGSGGGARGGGGGGATGPGVGGAIAGHGGPGLSSNFDGVTRIYSTGGGGSDALAGGPAASVYGGGGGGRRQGVGISGQPGVVIIRYKVA